MQEQPGQKPTIRSKQVNWFPLVLVALPLVLCLDYHLWPLF